MFRRRMLGLLALAPLPILGQVRTDAGVYREPPLAGPPAPGDIYKDPVFGASILRLSGSNDGSDCHVQYSYWPSFNSNNTRVHAVCVIGGTEELRVWRLDPIALARGPSVVLAIPTPSGWPVSSTDAIWSGIDPDVIVGHPANAQTINITNLAAGTNSVLKDLTGSLPAGGSLQQMSKSVDDNVFAFNVDVSGHRYGYVVWRRDNNNVFLQQDSNVDEVQIDKTGRYLTVVHNDGSDRVWDLSTGIVTDLGWNSADQGFFHHDSGRGVILSHCWTSATSTLGIGLRRLSNPRDVSRLLTFPSGAQDMHFSMTADDEAWGLVSGFSTVGAAASRPYENEIFLVATDGSGLVRRLAHHRSVYRAYADSPRANISRNGALVAFTSNWGNPGGRRDVYILRVQTQAH